MIPLLIKEKEKDLENQKQQLEDEIKKISIEKTEL